MHVRTAEDSSSQRSRAHVYGNVVINGTFMAGGNGGAVQLIARADEAPLQYSLSAVAAVVYLILAIVRPYRPGSDGLPPRHVHGTRSGGRAPSRVPTGIAMPFDSLWRRSRTTLAWTAGTMREILAPCIRRPLETR